MLSQFFIRRPIFACVISILIVLLGVVAYQRLPVEQYPELAPPIVRITALYPGANAEVIAGTVAAPIEEQVNGVDRMIYMSSTSSDGQYTLDVSFEPGTDVDIAAVLVQNRVSIAENSLPEEVRRLGVTTQKQSTAFVGVIALYSPDGSRDDVFLSNYLTLSMRDEFARIYGVGGINIIPAKEYGMRVWLDPNTLEQRRITVEDVNNAIRQQNVQVAAGVLGRQPAPEGTSFELFVTTKGRLTTPEEFGEIIVKSDEEGRTVRVRDVARVEVGAQSYTTLANFNGAPAAVMPVYQLPGANLVSVAESVRHKLDELRPNFPEGVEGVFFYDAAMFINASVHEVQKTLVEAFILVFLVVLVFLQSFRTALIPMLTIPVALVGTFLFMAMFGFSVNTLTMFGLVLAIGIVVDDAIVVVENVERNLVETGLPPKEATAKSMNEITGAIVAITLVLMSVFIPTAALPGITGTMYRQFALTIAASTFLSAINALTLSPALCGLLLKKHDPHHQPGRLARIVSWPARMFNKAFDATARGYGGLAYYTIRLAPVTLLAFAGVLLLSGWLYSRVPTGFVPAEDLGFVVVAAQLPDAASLERSHDVIRGVVEKVKASDGVANVVSLAGFSVLDGQGVSYANAWVVLDEWEERTPHGRTVDAIIADIQGAVAPIQEAQFIVFSLPPINGLGNTSGFDLRILDQQAAGRATLGQMVRCWGWCSRRRSMRSSRASARRPAGCSRGAGAARRRRTGRRGRSARRARTGTEFS